MATPGQLVSKLSEILTIPEPTMGMYDRVLRDAGLLSKGGRGRSAVQRTSLDTARLLIAPLVTSSPARAAEAVEDFGVLECHELHLKNPDALTLSKLCGVAFESVHTLESAVSAIIDGFGNGNFVSRLEEAASNFHGGREVLPHIGIKVWDTKVAAEINISGNLYIYHHPSLIKAIKTPLHPPNNAQSSQNLHNDYDVISSKYRGIRTCRELTMVEIKPIAEFVCGIDAEH